MATCKECLHNEVCSGFTPTDLDRDVFDYCQKGITEEIPDIEKRCSGFKNAADVVPRAVIAKIFAEIEGITHRMSTPVGEYTVVPNGRYAELKKKYMEADNAKTD